MSAKAHRNSFFLDDYVFLTSHKNNKVSCSMYDLKSPNESTWLLLFSNESFVLKATKLNATHIKITHSTQCPDTFTVIRTRRNRISAFFLLFFSLSPPSFIPFYLNSTCKLMRTVLLYNIIHVYNMIDIRTNLIGLVFSWSLLLWLLLLFCLAYTYQFETCSILNASTHQNFLVTEQRMLWARSELLFTYNIWLMLINDKMSSS